MPAEPVILALTEGGADTARTLAARIGGAHHRPAPGAVAEEIRALFVAGRPLVGVMAAGILIRALAPVLREKGHEPPVVALSEDGAVAVPLLGGHRGANALASRIAAALGGTAAVTTAGEATLGLALDAPPEGWRLEDPGAAKGAMAGLLSRRAATVSGGPDWLAPLLNAGRAVHRSAPADAPLVLTVEGAEPLVYRRPRLALGLGAARGADPDALLGLVRRTLAEEGLAAAEVGLVVSIDLKADEAAIHTVARDLGVEARFFPAARLAAERDRLATPSETVFAETGCHGVAEGAALAAVGPRGRLIVPKRKTDEATCAVAALPEDGVFAEPLPGCPRGRLAVVGLGPGHADWRTPEAARHVAEAELVVGYGLYLDLLGPLAAGKETRAFPLGGEEDRCRFALEAAADGRRVALVSSGDAGIYAMGALVMELLARDGEAGVSAAARRVEIVHAPGITAMQAASARAGALLGHDFCAISLSDLLTPRETILGRLTAAAAGDFVVGLYNPVSARRRTLLAEAREILAAARGPETPVLIARDLGRPGETLRALTLGDLCVDAVDMLSVVLVGSRESRSLRLGDRAAGAGGTQLFTPRGYAVKAAGTTPETTE